MGRTNPNVRPSVRPSVLPTGDAEPNHEPPPPNTWHGQVAEQRREHHADGLPGLQEGGRPPAHPVVDRLRHERVPDAPLPAHAEPHDGAAEEEDAEVRGQPCTTVMTTS